MKTKQGKNARKGQGPLDSYKEEVQAVVEFWTNQLDITVAEKQRLLQQALKEQQQRQALQQEQHQLQLQLAVSDEQKQKLQAALLQMQKEQAELKQLLDSMQHEVGQIRGLVAQDGAESAAAQVATDTALPLTPAASEAVTDSDTEPAAQAADEAGPQSAAGTQQAQQASFPEQPHAGHDHAADSYSISSFGNALARMQPSLPGGQPATIVTALPLFRQDSADSVEVVKAAASAAMVAADQAVARVLSSLAASSASRSIQQQQQPLVQQQQDPPAVVEEQQARTQQYKSPPAAATERFYPPASRVSGGGSASQQPAAGAAGAAGDQSGAAMAAAAAAAAVPAPPFAGALASPKPPSTAAASTAVTMPHPGLRPVAVRLAAASGNSPASSCNSSPRTAVVVAGGSPRVVVGMGLNTPRGIVRSPHARNAARPTTPMGQSSLYASNTQNSSDEENDFIMTAAQRMRAMHAGAAGNSSKQHGVSASSSGSGTVNTSQWQRGATVQPNRLDVAANRVGVITAAAAFSGTAAAGKAGSSYQGNAAASSGNSRDGSAVSGKGEGLLQQQVQPVQQPADGYTEQHQQQQLSSLTSAACMPQQAQSILPQLPPVQPQVSQGLAAASTPAELVQQQSRFQLEQITQQRNRLQQQQQQWLQQAHNLLLPPMPHLLTSLQQQPQSLWDPLQPQWQPQTPWLATQQPMFSWSPQLQQQPLQWTPQWGQLPSISQQLQHPAQQQQQQQSQTQQSQPAEVPPPAAQQLQQPQVQQQQPAQAAEQPERMQQPTYQQQQHEQPVLLQQLQQPQARHCDQPPLQPGNGSSMQGPQELQQQLLQQQPHVMPAAPQQSGQLQPAGPVGQQQQPLAILGQDSGHGVNPPYSAAAAFAPSTTAQSAAVMAAPVDVQQQQQQVRSSSPGQAGAATGAASQAASGSMSQSHGVASLGHAVQGYLGPAEGVGQQQVSAAYTRPHMEAAVQQSTLAAAQPPVSRPQGPAAAAAAGPAAPYDTAAASSSSRSSIDGRLSLHDLLAATTQQLAEVEACLAAQEALLADKHMTPAAALAAAAAEAARRRPVLMPSVAESPSSEQAAAAPVIIATATAGEMYAPAAAIAGAIQQQQQQQQGGALKHQQAQAVVSPGAPVPDVHSTSSDLMAAASRALTSAFQQPHHLAAAPPITAPTVSAAPGPADGVAPTAGTYVQPKTPAGAVVLPDPINQQLRSGDLDSPPAVGRRAVIAAAAPDTPEPKDRRIEVSMPPPALAGTRLQQAGATAATMHQTPALMAPAAAPAVSAPAAVSAGLNVATRHLHRAALAAAPETGVASTVSRGSEWQGRESLSRSNSSNHLPHSPRSPRVSTGGAPLAAVAGWMAATVLLQQQEEQDHSAGDAAHYGLHHQQSQQQHAGGDEGHMQSRAAASLQGPLQQQQQRGNQHRAHAASLWLSTERELSGGGGDSSCGGSPVSVASSASLAHSIHGSSGQGLQHLEQEHQQQQMHHWDSMPGSGTGSLQQQEGHEQYWYPNGAVEQQQHLHSLHQQQSGLQQWGCTGAAEQRQEPLHPRRQQQQHHGDWHVHTHHGEAVAVCQCAACSPHVQQQGSVSPRSRRNSSSGGGFGGLALQQPHDHSSHRHPQHSRDAQAHNRRNSSSGGGFGTLDMHPESAYTNGCSSSLGVGRARRLSCPLPVLGVTSPDHGVEPQTCTAAAVPDVHRQQQQPQFATHERDVHQHVQQHLHQQQEIDGVLPHLSPVDSPSGTPQPGSSLGGTGTNQQQQQRRQGAGTIGTSFSRARQSWDHFLQATGLQGAQPEDQEVDHRGVEQQHEYVEEQNWQQQCQQRQQHTDPVSPRHQQQPHKQHWLLADEVQSQTFGQLQRPTMHSRVCGESLMPLLQMQQTPQPQNRHTSSSQYHSNRISSQYPAAYAAANGGARGAASVGYYDHGSSLSPYRPATSSPAAAMMGLASGGSSSLRVAGAGGALGTFLAIIRRVMMVLCPNSWQWLLLVATSMLWGLKKLFGRGRSSTSGSVFGFGPSGGAGSAGGVGVVTVPLSGHSRPTVGAPVGIAADVLRRTSSPGGY